MDKPGAKTSIYVAGEAVTVREGICLAAALAEAGRVDLRSSPRAKGSRGAFCYMGTCRECRVTVDGHRVLACMEPVRKDMQVVLGILE